MKQLALIFVLAFLFSCKKESKESFGKTTGKTPEEAGKILFENEGNCASCHLKNQKVVGPSIEDIAKIYKEQGGNMVQFLKGEAQPIVDPSQYEVMKTNFAITKTMSDEELKAIESYIYSHCK